jgi:hypothetical protein
MACYRRRHPRIVTLSGFRSSCRNSLMSKAIPASAVLRQWNACVPFRL